MNIFKNAYFGKPYLCRNNTIAYYSRRDQKGKHWLMVNDDENDFISCNEDGHNFDPEELKKVIPEGRNKGKTICELYGWDYDEMVNHRLDIISEYQEAIGEEELDELADAETCMASDEFNSCLDDVLSLFDSCKQLKLIYRKGLIWAFKAGCRKTLERINQKK